MDKPFSHTRQSEAYIGVLIDDLVTKGTNEPYRIMTSRAEYRLLLRQDNADVRLTPKGHEIGLVSDDRYHRFLEKKRLIEVEIERLKETYAPPDERVNEFLEGLAARRSGAALVWASFSGGRRCPIKPCR